jgi:glycosyltransferase involved in cell wall biosynthesis
LKKNISAEIRILNNISTKDTLSAYNECDYFIHGSRIECSPLVMFETFAVGKIYLGTDVGNVKEILKKKGLGYCSNVLNNITNRLDYYISKNLHHNKINKKKIKIFHSKNFDWNILLKKYKKIYLEKN